MSREAYRVFISYSHDDEALRQELEKHLALLRREGRVRTWHDREITAGDEWRGQLDARLDAADLILLLVSASFIASDYCWDVETARALERHALGETRVVPVIVRPCDWQSAPFAELQALPRAGKPVTDWPNPDTAWLDVARGLRRAIGVLREEPAEDVPPRQPRYADEESRKLSRRLKGLFRRRKELTITGDDTRVVESEILDVRRMLRKGPQLHPGEFLGDGRYEIVEPIGAGGFATVWKAWDAEAEGLVALKVLHGHHGADRSRRERFFRGARKMAELHHPHIVRVLESRLEDDGWHFFVMEYVAGGNFEQAVLGGSLSVGRRLAVLLQVGEALELAHRRRAVHRDVKPSNILLDVDGSAKLTDFDLVRAEDTTGLTATRAMMGTVQFAAPEALESAKEVGPAADIYSLGATAVFAFLGGDCRRGSTAIRVGQWPGSIPASRSNGSWRGRRPLSAARGSRRSGSFAGRSRTRLGRHETPSARASLRRRFRSRIPHPEIGMRPALSRRWLPGRARCGPTRCSACAFASHRRGRS